MLDCLALICLWPMSFFDLSWAKHFDKTIVTELSLGCPERITCFFLPEEALFQATLPECIYTSWTYPSKQLIFLLLVSGYNATRNLCCQLFQVKHLPVSTCSYLLVNSTICPSLFEQEFQHVAWRALQQWGSIPQGQVISSTSNKAILPI